jgi:hypothetical protein
VNEHYKKRLAAEKRRLAEDAWRRKRENLLYRGLKERFSTPQNLMRHLGMDSASYLRPKGFDTAPIKEFMAARGISADDIESMMKMLPIDEWSDMDMDDAAEQQGRQRRLETGGHEYAAQHEHDNRRAAERQDRDSRQSEDNINANRVHGGKGAAGGPAAWTACAS